MLALEPAAVRLDRAVEDYGGDAGTPATVFRRPITFSGDPASGTDYSRTGAHGDPTLASAATGAVLLAAMSAELLNGLQRLRPEAMR